MRESSRGWEWALGVWRRRKWLGAFVLALVGTATICIVTFLPDVYQSTATVLIDRPQVADVFVRPSVTGELDARLQTISQQILSRARLKDVVARFGLYPDLTSRFTIDGIAERMRRDIRLELKGVQSLSGQSTTIAFALSYRGQDPRTVATVTNTLASFYVDENSKMRERQAHGTAAFLGAQLDEAKRRLVEQERRLGEYRLRYLGELPQQVAQNLAAVERLSTQLQINRDNVSRAMERRSTLLRQVAEAESTGPVRLPDTPASRLDKLKDQLRELRTQYSELYPDVIRVKTEIATLEGEAAAAAAEGRAESTEPAPDPLLRRLRAALGELDSDIEGLKADGERLRRDIASYQQRTESAPRREQEYQELSREYDVAKDLYQSLLKRAEDARLADSAEQGQKGEQFRILDPALASSLPAAPNRPRLLFVGLLLSLAVAAVVVVLAEQFDTSFHTVDDLRALSRVPVLVSIPLVVTAVEARRERRRAALTAVTVVLVLAVVAKASQHVAVGNEFLVGLLSRGGS